MKEINIMKWNYTSIRKRFPDLFCSYPVISVYKKFVISNSILTNFSFVPFRTSITCKLIHTFHLARSSFVRKLFHLIHNARMLCSRMHNPHSIILKSSIWSIFKYKCNLQFHYTVIWMQSTTSHLLVISIRYIIISFWTPYVSEQMISTNLSAGMITG